MEEQRLGAVRGDDRPGAASIAVRALAATLGAYAVTFYLAAALTGLLSRARVEPADATMIGSVVALLVFPAVSIWAFAERRAWVVVAAPALAAAALALLAGGLKP